MKKATVKKVNSGNSVNGNPVNSGSCIIPDNIKSAQRTSISYSDSLVHTHNINEARLQTEQNRHTALMETLKNKSYSSLLAISAHATYLATIEREALITEKMRVIDIALTAIGLTMTENELRNKAMISLNLQPIISVQNRTKSRNALSITDNGLSGSIDHNLINKTVLEYDAVPFGQLPNEVKTKFNQSSKERYPSIASYRRTWLSKGNQGSGFFAVALRQNLDITVWQNLPETVKETINGRETIYNRPGYSTWSRMRDSIQIDRTR